MLGSTVKNKVPGEIKESSVVNKEFLDCMIF